MSTEIIQNYSLNLFPNNLIFPNINTVGYSYRIKNKKALFKYKKFTK